MDTGQLRHRVGIQSRTLGAADAYGHGTESWSTDDTVWARVEPLSGDERMNAEQVESSTTHRVTIRYRDGVSSKNRLLWGSRVFHISSVADWQEREWWLELMCEEMEQETA